MSQGGTNRQLQCVVVTPERTVVDQPADFVAMPMFDGELGVLPGRAPLIGRLGAGELRIRRGASTLHFYVDGGFAQVRSDTVTLLTSKAIRAEDIDKTVVTAQMEAARQPVATAEARTAQQTILAKARTQLRVASHVGGASAGV